MRAVVAALSAIVAALVLAGPAPAASGTLVDTADAGSFPHRMWALSVPADKAVPAAEVRVTENGRPVRDLHVETSDPSGVAARRFATVLVIDVSSSMHGDSIRGAMKAARAFAKRRQPTQSLGVVLFNARARVLLEPTTDAETIDAALARLPRLGRGTHLYDGVGLGVDVLARTGMPMSSLVVLSDGDDTGSRQSFGAVTRAARRGAVRIFTVGLRSKVFTPTSLESLADASGGTATVADSSRTLRRAFDALGKRLGAEYLVRYRSTRPAGKLVRVSVDVDGGGPEAIAEYRPPLAAAAVAAGTSSPSAFWTSPAAVASVVIICMLLLGLGFWLAYYRPDTIHVTDRIAAYAASTGSGETGSKSRYVRTADHLAQALSASVLWRRFIDEVHVARMSRSPQELALAAGGTSAAALLLTVVTGAAALLLPALIIPIGVVVAVRIKAARERARFGEQLPDNLQVFASALRAGHSFTGALGAVVDDAPEPTRRELSRALSDERLGVPIEEALAGVGTRMRAQEMNQVAMIAALQQETGGNTAEVLDRVVDNVRARQDLLRMVKSLTAQGRISQFVVTSLPPAMALLMTVINPGYLTPLVESGAGKAMLVVAVVMVMIGSLAIRKIVRIRV